MRGRHELVSERRSVCDTVRACDTGAGGLVLCAYGATLPLVFSVGTSLMGLLEEVAA